MRTYQTPQPLNGLYIWSWSLNPTMKLSSISLVAAALAASAIPIHPSHREQAPILPLPELHPAADHVQCHTFCQKYPPAPHPPPQAQSLSLQPHRIQHHNALQDIEPAIEATKQATAVAAGKGQYNMMKLQAARYGQLVKWHQKNTSGFKAKEPTMKKQDIKDHATKAWYFKQQAKDVIDGEPLGSSLKHGAQP